MPWPATAVEPRAGYVTALVVQKSAEPALLSIIATASVDLTFKALLGVKKSDELDFIEFRHNEDVFVVYFHEKGELNTAAMRMLDGIVDRPVFGPMLMIRYVLQEVAGGDEDADDSENVMADVHVGVDLDQLLEDWWGVRLQNMQKLATRLASGKVDFF